MSIRTKIRFWWFSKWKYLNFNFNLIDWTFCPTAKRLGFLKNFQYSCMGQVKKGYFELKINWLLAIKSLTFITTSSCMYWPFGDQLTNVKSQAKHSEKLCKRKKQTTTLIWLHTISIKTLNPTSYWIRCHLFVYKQ